VPVDEARLVGLIRDQLPLGQTVGVALSGGGDSTALLHLCLTAGLRVEAVTVDHRLRPESAVEAASVAAACAALGVRHDVRVWDHGLVTGNLMDQARQARMALITAWAQERGIGAVSLGHTRDDVAEGVLMGLSRAAGLAGLSGMRGMWRQSGISFHRPLLKAGRAELRDWLRASGIGWHDDPSNENARFTRVKARKALAILAPLGITADRLAEVAGHLAQVQAALETQVAEVAARWLHEAAGALRFDAGLWSEPAEVQRQAVQRALMWLSGETYAPRAADLQRLIVAMATGRDATLAGCRARSGWLMREPFALGGAVPVGELWDRRWRVAGPAGEVRALGAEGLRQVKGWRSTGLSREVLVTTPAVWDGTLLCAAPLAGFSAGWQAQLEEPFTFRR
jgi:tRNA(Ile)-lysidine synthase